MSEKSAEKVREAVVNKVYITGVDIFPSKSTAEKIAVEGLVFSLSVPEFWAKFKGEKGEELEEVDSEVTPLFTATVVDILSCFRQINSGTFKDARENVAINLTNNPWMLDELKKITGKVTYARSSVTLEFSDLLAFVLATEARIPVAEVKKSKYLR